MILKKIRLLSNHDPSYLFLAIAILIGGYIRLFPVLQSEFPINDGGMFYSMTKDIMANGYRLPETTSYNHLNLPFAYPPLSFYFSGLLADLTSWELIDIIRILPAIFAILAIPAFYLLASVLIYNKNQAVIATYIFTFIPASFDWFVMGGGLARSPAFFFALLSLYFIYRLFTRNRNQDILWTILFSSLTILSHPDIALHTLASALVFFIFFGRNKRGLLKSIVVAGLTIFVTAPWWITILSRYGITPILAAGGTGFYNMSEIIRLLLFDLTHEYVLQTIGTLALIGFFWHIARRKFFVPIWLIVIFLSEPRSATSYISPCIAILASYSLTKILHLFNTTTLQRGEESGEPHPLSSKVSKGLFSLLTAHWIYSSLAIMIVFINTTTLTDSDKNAFDWIKINTPDESQFLVLTGQFSLRDSVSEWFPALTDRTSIATVQGYEWDRNISFDEILIESANVQKCIYLTFGCVENWAEKNQKDINYIYIHNPVLQADTGFWSSSASALWDLSLTPGDSELVYKNDKVSIYKVFLQ
jgi:hypothetical protein